MTAQINDSFFHNDTHFSVAGISTGELFNPAVLDLQPVSASTMCWRGYQAVYAVVDGHLVVANLIINLPRRDKSSVEPQPGPAINGVESEGPDDPLGLFSDYYRDVNYHLEYSGGVLLASGFIEELYVHMGFHPPWKYEHVIELVFENGILMAEHDRSAQMAEIREMIANSEDHKSRPTREEIEQFVQRAFDRTYRM